MEKIVWGHVGSRLIQHMAKPSAVLGSNIHAQVLFFHIVRAWQCFNWFKAFLVNKPFVLTKFSDSKLVPHMTNNIAVFFLYTMLYFPKSTVQEK